MKKRSKMWLNKLKSEFGKEPPSLKQWNCLLEKSILFIYNPLVF